MQFPFFELIQDGNEIEPDPAIVAERPRFRLRRVWLYLMVVPAILFLITAVGFGALFHHIYFYRGNLPELDDFIRFDLPRIGRVYDSAGNVLFESAREYRQIVSYDELPPVLLQAILSAEDKNFFSHLGVDYGVFLRVVWRNLAGSPKQSEQDEAGEDDGQSIIGLQFSQGGSTITQQLIRGYFLLPMTSRERSNYLTQDGFLPRLAVSTVGASATNKLARKLEEIRLSVWLEEKLTEHYGSALRAKQEILARYANLLYMGNGRYGFAAAAAYYFGKPLESLTVDDADKAALLAGIVKSPRDYAPLADNIERTTRRRDAILDLMVKNDYLTPEKAEQCRHATIEPVVHAKFKTMAPTVINTLFSELKELKSESLNGRNFVQGRFLVHSTADSEIQDIVNEAFENGLKQFEKRHPKSKDLIQGGVIVLRNADATILAEAGGRRFFKERNQSFTDFNRVSQSLRQPGSAMKPIVYLAAFRIGTELDQEVMDEPISVPMEAGKIKWIRNYDDRFKGPIPVRQALAESRNAALTWIVTQMGMKSVLRTAKELGIVTPLNPYISTALGASEVSLVELANAYRAMASGIVAKPRAIQRITDPAGVTILSSDNTAKPLNIDIRALQQIQEGLRGVVRIPGGTAHSLGTSDFPIPVMGKTGTTNECKDALFIGSTYGPTGITVAVRLGFDDNSVLGKKETGARAALPIFKEIISTIYKRKLVGEVPSFPPAMEQRITEYINKRAEQSIAVEQTEQSASLLPVTSLHQQFNR